MSPPSNAITPVPETAADRAATQLSPSRRAILERWLRGDQTGAPRLPSIPPRGDDQPAPLSPAQLQLWTIHQLDPLSSAYNETDALRCRGPIDAGALRAASNGVIARHQILRTTFRMIDGHLLQVIAPHLDLPMPIEDLAAASPAQREVTLRRRLAEEAKRPFDLARGPLIRTRLFRLADDDHVLLRSTHHIIWDERSADIWLDELARLYVAITSGASLEDAASGLPPLPIQYADYSAWQAARIEEGSASYERHVAFWRQRLANRVPLRLPVCRQRRGGGVGGTYRFALDAELTARLRRLARDEGATLFMVLFAAFQLLLARYTGATDVAVGTPVSNRSHAETEGLIGFFVNTIVLRTDLSGNPALHELLRRVQQETLAAYEHQEMPFERLVALLRPGREAGRTPLFEAMFAFQAAPAAATLPATFRLEPFPIEVRATKFDLHLTVTEQAPDYDGGHGDMTGKFAFSTDLFELSAIERFAGCYRALLDGMTR